MVVWKIGHEILILQQQYPVKVVVYLLTAIASVEVRLKRISVVIVLVGAVVMIGAGVMGCFTFHQDTAMVRQQVQLLIVMDTVLHIQKQYQPYQ